MAFTSYGAHSCITDQTRLIYEHAEGFPEPTQQRNAPTSDEQAGRFCVRGSTTRGGPKLDQQARSGPAASRPNWRHHNIKREEAGQGADGRPGSTMTLH